MYKKNVIVRTVAPDTLSGVRKEKPDRGSNNFCQRLTIHVNVNKQASLLAATSHAAKVFELKQRLERAEEDLGQARKQLEDKQGM